MRGLFQLMVFLLPFLSFSQTNIVNRSLTDSSINIAYIGVGNTIELIGYKNQGKISFSTTNGTLTDIGQNRYVLYPFQEGECTIIVKEKDKLIAKKIFKAEHISVPFLKIGSRYDSISKDGYTYFIKHDNLISDPVLRIEVSNCYFKESWKILSYRVILEGSGFDTTTEINVSGPESTTRLVQKMRDFGSIKFIVIEKIWVLDPDGKGRFLVPLIVVVN